MTNPTRRLLRLVPVFAIGTVVGAVADALAQSCAMCGSGLSDDPLGRAISWSILFLMATPYTIVGTVALSLVWIHRRAAGRRRTASIDLARLQPAAGQPSGGGLAGVTLRSPNPDS